MTAQLREQCRGSASSAIGGGSRSKDNEPALIALRDALIAKLPESAVPIGPPSGESPSNGAIENGVKVCKGFLRVHLGA